MEALDMDIVRQLEEFRLENKISQEELARRLGVAFSTVNRWFNGHSQPNKIQTYHLKKLLNHQSNSLCRLNELERKTLTVNIK
jgi:transcriptional regulator with XRE-family HTH domain